MNDLLYIPIWAIIILGVGWIIGKWLDKYDISEEINETEGVEDE